MHTLFVTRKFPPSTGGMENMAASLHAALAEIEGDRVSLIKWGGSNRWLPIVYPAIALRTLAFIAFRRPDAVYLQDGVLAPIGRVAKSLFRKTPVAITIHGLEVTYKNPVYRAVALPAIARMDAAIAISASTKEVLDDAVPAARSILINNGVDDVFHADAPAAQLIDTIAADGALAREQLAGRRVLVTTGRLIERKGVAWFVDNVMPTLAKKSPEVQYVVVGSGPLEATIRDAIERHSLAGHVQLVGRVSGPVRDALYNLADAFVMPNIDVPGDMEGFGLVALEASSCGTPAIAAAVGGITDAVQPGKNGSLVDPGDADGFVRELTRVATGKSGFDRAKVRTFVLDTYGWRLAARSYRDALAGLVDARA